MADFRKRQLTRNKTMEQSQQKPILTTQSEFNKFNFTKNSAKDTAP